MSEDVPTFGRENLPRIVERALWDFWAKWHKQLTEPDEPEST